MRRILKLVFGFLFVSTVVWGAGQLVTRSKSSQDPAADDLDVYTFWMNKQIVSRSQALRRVTSRVLMGGAVIDLREAKPSPDGLSVDVGTAMGGTALLVPKEWNVILDEQSENSQVQIALDPGAGADADAPVVDVLLRTRYGGALVGHELPSDWQRGG
jgi:hypothetical protein